MGRLSKSETSVIIKCDRYSIVREVLLSGRLSQSEASVIIKCDRYSIVR